MILLSKIMALAFHIQGRYLHNTRQIPIQAASFGLLLPLKGGGCLLGGDMYKACARCGKMHPHGYQCSVGASKRIYASTEERKQRSTYAWTLKSQEIRDRAHYLCEICLAEGKINYKNIEVHHIVKLKDDRAGLLNNDNLICLCQEHHKKADKNEIAASYLKELARFREAGGIHIPTDENSNADR